MQKSQYVILTGGKNNAGDFLIKYKAKRLFKALRPELNVVDFDGWKPLNDDQLEIINSSKALILLGGPALRGDMYPSIFPLRKNLDDITVPILVMGVGYKEDSGTWQNTHNYPFTNATTAILKRIEASEFPSSVRDYHTLNVLNQKGYKNFIMTGCPALYELDHIHASVGDLKAYNTIAFSLGVSYLTSKSMKKQMQEMILSLKNKYPNAVLTVYFHHAIRLEEAGQAEMVAFLKKHSIGYEDISGSEKRLVEVYGTCDIHIGYRVHAHVHASSMSVPSILINEDSRGKGFHTVMGGMMIDGYYTLPRFNRSDASMMYKIMGAVKKIFFTIQKHSPFEAYAEIPKDVLALMDYELQHGFPRTRMTRASIDVHFEEMKKYILALPN